MIKASDDYAEDRAEGRPLTLLQVARLLSLHPNTVRSLAQRGQIRGAKIGGAWRFLDADVFALIRNGRPADWPPTVRFLGQGRGAHQAEKNVSGSERPRAWTEKLLDRLLDGASPNRLRPR